MSQPLEGEGQAHKTHTTAVPLVPTFSVSSQSDYVIQGQVNGVSINILVDTGAATTVLSARAWEKIGLSTRLTPTPKKLVGVQGNPLQLLGATRISIMLQEQEFTTDVTVADALTTDLILGRDFLKAQQCTIQMGKNQDVLLLQQFGMAIPLTHKKVEPKEAHYHHIVKWKSLGKSHLWPYPRHGLWRVATGFSDYPSKLLELWSNPREKMW